MTTPPRRGSLLGSAKAAADQVAADATGTARFSRQREDMVTTAIYLPKEALAMLRLVAVRRANAEGTRRPSVSDVLVGLIEAHRTELEREANG